MKKTVTLSALLALSSSVAQAAPSIAIGVDREFFMSSPKTADFIIGVTRIGIHDGYFTIWDDCELDPSETYIPPFTANPFPDCPKGTTGFILSGDVDKDGLSDARLFWSVATVEDATYIESALSDQITLVAAPPSKLVRPQTNFVDDSVGLFYNTVSLDIREFNNAHYYYTDTYTNYADHHQTWVPGVYVYTVPLRKLAPLTGPLSMSVTPMIESNAYRKGVVGFGVVTKQWSNGAQEIDPRLISTMGWEGNVRNNTFATDELNFGIYDTVEAIPTQTNMLDHLKYPTSRGLLTLPSNVQKTLRILPFAFSKGTTGVARLNMYRKIDTSVLAQDQSERDFFWNMRFIDSYIGHAQYEYRFQQSTVAVPGIKVVGKTSTLIAPNGDYDGDGLLNIFEFAFSQDDGDDLSSTLEWTTYNQFLLPAPVLPIGITAPVGVGPVYVDTLAAGVPNTILTVNKRSGVGGSITYGYEVNYDTTNPKSKWVKIKGPKPGETLVIKDSKAGAIAGNSNFTWTITDTFDTPASAVPPLPALIGATSIQASDALPTTVRVRSTAAVTSGY
jgi:hypothetical protein